MKKVSCVITTHSSNEVSVIETKGQQFFFVAFVFFIFREIDMVLYIEDGSLSEFSWKIGFWKNHHEVQSHAIIIFIASIIVN